MKEIDQTLTQFVQKLDKDPSIVRKSFLDAVAEITGARNIALILKDDEKYLWPENSPFSDLDEAIIRSQKSKMGTVHFEDVWLCRLSWRHQIAGTLILKKNGTTSPWNSIRDVSCLYAFWETSHQLRHTLQMLSAESASVAREFMRLSDQMNANQNRLQGITKGILRTQEEERAKISRDLHDGIGQELTALKMNLDMLSVEDKLHLSPEDSERWNETRSLAEQTLQEVRELSRLLRPRMLDDLGLFPTLRWYVRNFTKRVNIPVDLVLEGEEEKLTPEIQTILFRVTQEALNNVAKHSRATSAEVHFRTIDEHAELQISDNGIGFDAPSNASETSSGLSGMRDRVTLYKGRFVLHSEREKGTKLEITLPLV